jgi:PAS domain S-box-containing protein
MKPRIARHLISIPAVTVIYLGAARLGLSLAFLHASVSPVWPPTGVAIAAVLWLGYRTSPAILLGAFLANLATGVSAATALGIATGNTLEAVSAAYLLHRFVGSRSPFGRAQDVSKFVIIAGMLSPMISATIGNMSLCLGGAASWAGFGPLWLTWWLGDGSGALVLAPLVLTWVEKSPEQWSLRRSAEAALLIASLSSVALFVFGGFFLTKVANYPLGHLTIPLLLWAAFRFGPRGAATTTALLAGIAIWGTTRGFGPFAEQNLNESLLLLQVFVVAAAITALVLAAVVTEHKRAQSEITFLASIVESTDDAVIGKTLDGTILSWNKGAERIYGYAADEVVGRSISLLIPSDRADDLPRILETLKQGRHIEHYETVRVRKDGKQINMSLTISPIKDASGKIAAASMTARDITERKRAEEALRAGEDRLRAIVDNTTAFIYVKDLQGKYILMNRRGLTTLGLDWEQVQGKTDREIFPQEMADAYVENDRKVLEGRIALQSEDPGIEADGRHTYLTVKFPLCDADGTAYAICGISTDITDLKRVEEEREQLLLREQAARTEAEAANQAKDEFLALVSHELRTPLNAIVGWVDILLKSGHDEALTARALQVIKRNADLQVRIIEDILDVSRIIVGKLQLEMRPVEITGIIQAALAAAQPMADAKSIRLHQLLAPIADPVSGDTQRLQQVAWNLLSNAIKFTPAGGQVEMTLQQIGSNVQITVSDTGEGIPKEALPHIFDRFRQADSSSTRKHGGLGLGLAIVRHLAELHGGTVEAYSAGEGQGAVFTVTLPCVTAAAEFVDESEGGLADRASVLSGLRILVVDDDSDSREVLADLLALRGAEAKSAATAREALQVISEWKPDVLISDIGMPDEDGYDLIRKVRTLESMDGRHVPAIALTGYAGREDGERALSAGYQFHLAKPVDPNGLVNVIASFVRKNGERPGA